MLSLTRRLNHGPAEATVILTLPDGRPVRIVLVPWKGESIRMHIDAPADVKIMRAELLGEGAAGEADTTESRGHG